MEDNKIQGRPWSDGSPYSVTLWESEPGCNDDCNTGADFNTLGEARACIADLGAHFNMAYYHDTPFILLEGGPENLWEVSKNPLAKKRRTSDDGEWKREQAMQAGMEGGCEAYNEHMGYD